MNFVIAILGDWSNTSERDGKADRVPAFSAALDAYKFLFKNFWQALRLLLLPIIVAGLVLYGALNRYLAELISFLAAPDPRVASLALGTLAAGVFLSLFCYAIAVSSICDLALGQPPRSGWLLLKAQRQEWRLYAAYMRVLLLFSVIIALAFMLFRYVAPLLSIPVSFSAPVLTFVGSLGVIWLFARVGFLVAPIVAASTGTVLRKALKQSTGDFYRNSILLALLLVPGVLLLALGGYAFRMQTGALRIGGSLPLADSAQSMRETLGGFLTVISLALFVTIILLTVGAIAAYQTKRFRQVVPGRKTEAAIGSSLDGSVPDEALPR